MIFFIMFCKKYKGFRGNGLTIFKIDTVFILRASELFMYKDNLVIGMMSAMMTRCIGRMATLTCYFNSRVIADMKACSVSI